MTIGRIYKISSKQLDKVYIGSTSKDIEFRLKQHKRNYKCYLNNHHNYVTSFELIKYEDCIIELLEEIDYKLKKELLILEQKYIDLYNDKAINSYNRSSNKEKKKTYKTINRITLVNKPDFVMSELLIKRYGTKENYINYIKQSALKISKITRERNKVKYNEMSRMAYYKNKEEKLNKVKKYQLMKSFKMKIDKILITKYNKFILNIELKNKILNTNL